MRTWRRTWSVCVIGMALVGLVACSDDEESVTAPGVLDVSGNWMGNATLASATGGGCLGDLFRSQIGLTTPIEFEIDQAGQVLNGTQVDTTGGECEVTGSVTDNEFTLTVGTCELETVEGVDCLNGAERDLVQVTTTVNGVVEGDDATGNLTTTWDLFDSTTGADAGTLTVEAEFSVSR